MSKRRFLGGQRTYTHWVGWDTPADKARAKLDAGSGFVIVGYYNNHSNNVRNTYIAEIKSSDAYDDLDLDVNSGSSPLHYIRSRPKAIGKKLDADRFWNIFGLSPPSPPAARRARES